MTFAGINSYCSKTDGKCRGSWCFEGVYTYCQIGFWGPYCNNSCMGNYCFHCYSGNGTCFKCMEGYQLQNGACANTGSSGNCVDTACSVCHSGFWGPSCQYACGASGCASCDHYTGVCLHCKTGLWGTECQHNCSIHCRYMNCDLSTGYCSSCTSSKYWGPECKYDCPEGCTSNCNKNTGVCSSCNQGLWGDKCDKICNFNCGTCSMHTGKCVTCGPRSWGSECQHNCSDYCQDRKCSSSTGRCLSCVNFNWGENCEYKCPSGCLNDCDRDSGVCPRCLSYSRWGTYCNLTCEETCRHCAQDGTCLSAEGSDLSNVAFIAIGAVTVLTLVVVIGAAVFYIRKRKHVESLPSQMNQPHYETHDKRTAETSGWSSHSYMEMKEEVGIDNVGALSRVYDTVEL